MTLRDHVFEGIQMKTPIAICLGAVLTGAMPSVSARAADDTWEHTLAVYMVGSSINGTAGIGNVEADVDVSFSDILDNLDAGAMLAYRVERRRWAVVADLIYLGLENSKSGLGPGGRTRAKAEADQLIFELDLSYALSERLGVYGGLRYWDLDADLTIVAAEQSVTGSASESWIDPLVGLRYAAPLGGKWTLIAKGDVGGFGVGSDFSWGATALAAYQVSEHANLLLGYRHIDVDYDDGSGADRFLWDVWEGGPTAGFAWRF